MESLASAQARDWAIMASCLAAAALADEALSRRDKASRLMDCLGVLSAAFPIGTAPSLGEFRLGLHGPLKQLLPPGAVAGPTGELVLLDGADRLNDEVEDICREHYLPDTALEQHWSWPRLRAEQEERKLYRELRGLGESGYSKARGLLVDLPAGELRALRRVWDEIWPRIGDYRPISEMPGVQLEGWWFACPACRWPMRMQQASGGVWRVRCDAHATRGVAYTASPAEWRGGRPVLQGSGRAARDVVGQPASSDHLAVSSSVWRFITVPGVLECELRDHAKRAGAQVTMWPHMDAYDLRIALNGKVWQVDAKAWASPVALADALEAADPPMERLHIVIPDYQRPVVRLLNERLGRRRMTVCTAADLKRAIVRAAKESR